MKLFEEAYETASKNLSPAHPIAIIIADDFSSLQFFNLISVDKAHAIATETYNKGLSQLPGLSDELKFWANEVFDVLKWLKTAIRF